MAYGRTPYVRAPYARLFKSSTPHSVAADARLPAESSATRRGDAFAPSEVLAPRFANAFGPIEIRGSAPRGVAGAYGRMAFGRGAYGCGYVAPAGASTAVVAAPALLRAEALASQIRWANAQGAYPIVNRSSSLAAGMVGAYFPGYGAPVADATGTWNALATGAYGTAGALANNATGKAMAFDGVLNGLWATGSGLPLAGATQFTVACVCEVNGPTHLSGGACFALSQSTSVSNRLLYGWTMEQAGVAAPAGQGWFYFNAQMGATNLTEYTGLQTMPTGRAVLLATFDLGALSANYYLNGNLIGTQALASGASMAGFDTVSIGCRVTASQLESGCTITNGSAAMTGPASNEDITIGSPLTDPAGYIPAGTYCTADSPLGNYTLSQAATGTESNFLATWLGPFTRLKNGTVNLGATWNRILSAAEIASFSANPSSAFLFGEGAQIEALSGMRGDPGLAAELFAGQRAAPPLPAESAGAASLIENSLAPLESLVAARDDALMPIEGPGNQRADAAPPIDSLGTTRADDASPCPEWLASALRDFFGLPFEWTRTVAASVVADAFLQNEILSRLQTDAVAPIEWTGTLAAAVTTDTSARIEWVGVFRADRQVVAEALRNISVDMSAMVAELLVTAQRGQRAALEALSVIRLDAGLQDETQGQALIVFDIGLPIEGVGLLFQTDTVANLEASASAVSGARLPQESGFTIPAMLLSVEHGRILTTPGRIRLLKPH